jgi:predicted RNA-binding protein YlqC (UPF0109 family)
VSSFDDEFGLFGEDSEEIERRPTLGARKIASTETIIDHVEREEEAPRRRQPRGPRQQTRRASSGDPWAGHRRAADLLGFLARKLVAKPDSVQVELFMDEHQEPVIEVVVDPEDLGKVIGRDGRVARALRTIGRATAEGRVSIDILDSEEAADELENGDEVE